VPSDDIRWLTYREMVEVLSLPSEKAAISRSRREKWPRQINNERGLALVGVPLSAVEAAANRPLPEKPIVNSIESPIETPLARTPSDALEVQLRQQIERAEAGERRQRVRAEKAEADARAQAERAARAEGEAMALRDALVREMRRLEQAEADRQTAETQRDVVRTIRDAALAERDAAQGELADWTVGGPIARAWRAFMNRRGRS
jgi:hypothetical protein